MIKVKNNKKYECRFLAVECPNCQEQIELDNKKETEIIYPYCRENLVFED